MKITKPYRRVLDNMEDLMPEICWNCKVEFVRVDTSFGPVCFGCEKILNALPVADIELDSDDAMDADIDDVSWSVKITTPAGVPTLTMCSEYWDGVRVEIDYASPTCWFLGVAVEGQNMHSLTAAELDRSMSLGEIMEHGLNLGEQYDGMANYRDYDFESSEIDDCYDASDPFDMAYDVY